MMTIEEQIKAGLERCNAAMRAKGYGAAAIEIQSASIYFAGRRWLVQVRTPTRVVDHFGDTFDEAIEGLLGTIADLPPAWTADQVAATLGIEVAA